ncbi:2-hydroxyacid dehydrogenase [Jiulongibacter sediminis]|uniref:Phosphoglycerate dehydrogenase n=1 Tax=Jiulongibacter sediminis TaxID=1605367 RepID=A0A0P7BU93_9BACT|nr:hydroxyacid dehydrogenase [Jiulongibacter sediminis]KPM48282.1 phosphoglycerate dehydrogenase [Jiulongibacter sediminis]TBX24823.1 phosphoglycerate dehydrogenase [Jiulongibacter sediminis]
MSKIVLLETLAEPAMAILQKAGDVELLTAYDFNIESLDKQNVEAVITRGKGQITPEFMDQLPQLKMVARAGVGLDNVDINYATQKGIKVLNNPGVNSQTVAEHAISLMLMLQRNMFQAVSKVKEGNWSWRNEFSGDEIYGKTLGVLGMGTIGQKVAKIAEAMGMKIIYSDPVKHYLPYTYASLEDVLKEADILTLHVPLFDETRNLINEKTLSLMKKTALIINTARGPIIDEKAVYEALVNQKLGGFAADVTNPEPPLEGSPFIGLPNVLITAHLASLTDRTYHKMCVDAVQNVLALLRNEEPQEGCIFNKLQLTNA